MFGTCRISTGVFILLVEPAEFCGSFCRKACVVPLKDAPWQWRRAAWRPANYVVVEIEAGVVHGTAVY